MFKRLAQFAAKNWLLATLLLLGGSIVTLPLLSPFLVAKTPLTGEIWLQKGKEYFEKGEFQKAMDAWQQSLEIAPDLAESHYQLGIAYHRFGLRSDARRALSDCVQLDPKMREGQLALGRLLLAEGDRGAASDYAQSLFDHKYGEFAGHVLTGQIASAEGQLGDGVAEFDKALELDPNSLDAYLMLGAAHAKQQQLGKAERAIQEAKRRHPTELAAHIALANLYQGTQRWDEAEQAYRDAVELQPDNAQTHFLLGQFYALRNQSEDAYPCLKKAIEFDPGLIDARKHLGLLLLKQNRLPEVKAMVAVILSVSPGDLDGLYLRGRSALVEEQFQQALDTLLDVRRRKVNYAFGPYPADLAYLIALAQIGTGNLHSALDELEKSVREKPESSQRRLLLADLAVKLRRPWKSMVHANQLLDVDPENLAARIVLGKAHLQADRHSRAVEVLLKALALAPKNPAVHHALGLAYWKLSKPKEAIESFEIALAFSPRKAEALAQIATIYSAQGKTQFAIQRCLQQIERVPDDSAMRELLGRLYLSEQNPKMAKESLRKAIALAPDRPEPYFFLGTMYEAAKSYRLAEELYEQTLAANPKHIWAANNLAWLYSAQGENLERALSLAEMAAEQMPTAPPILDTLGWICYKLQIFKEAISSLQKCVLHAPRDPLYRYHLGMAYYRDGDLANATTTLRMSLELDQAHTEAETARAALAQIQATDRKTLSP